MMQSLLVFLACTVHLKLVLQVARSKQLRKRRAGLYTGMATTSPWSKEGLMNIFCSGLLKFVFVHSECILRF
ncbi:hypothetical protein M758_UG053300 [Ceratodon purpureus]|nr:hypothetical protein M758_UG053300 [Ceratodon purpureus]